VEQRRKGFQKANRVINWRILFQDATVLMLTLWFNRIITLYACMQVRSLITLNLGLTNSLGTILMSGTSLLLVIILN